MKIYDISLSISPDLPTWPGDLGVTLDQVSKISAGAIANVTQISMSAHAGTHVDAPYHFLEDGISIDQIPIKSFNGRAYVIHLPDIDLITADILRQAEIPPRTKRILFKTRNSNYWVLEETDFQPDFVALSADAASYLIKSGIKLVGVDYLSVAPYDYPRPTHEILLRAGVIILEGLNLSQVNQGRYKLHCLPLKLKGADGAPARAFLVGD